MEDFLNNAHEMEIRLWEYIDGFSSDSEHSIIEKLINENNEWKSKYHQLLEIQHLMSNNILEEPSMRFTRNVMEEIAKFHIAPATKNYINKKIIWGIAIFFLTTIFSFLVYGISQIKWSAPSGNDSFGKFNLTKIDLTPMFNNTYMNLFMMLNVVLGLMLLDSFLTSKRKKYFEEA